MEYQDVAVIESTLENFEEHNGKVRMNLAKRVATDDAEVYRHRYEEKTAEIERVRSERLNLLKGASFPLDGLSIGKDDKGLPVIVYHGKQWDCLSSMQQMRVSTAIVRKLSPNFGFILLDGLERFDMKQLQELQEWLESEDMQAIATRVSTGEECRLIIEEGMGEMPDPSFETPKQTLDI